MATTARSMRVASDVFQRNRGGSFTLWMSVLFEIPSALDSFVRWTSSFSEASSCFATPLSSVVVHLDNFPQTRDANETVKRALTYADRVRALALSFPQTCEGRALGFSRFRSRREQAVRVDDRTRRMRRGDAEGDRRGARDRRAAAVGPARKSRRPVRVIEVTAVPQGPSDTRTNPATTSGKRAAKGSGTRYGHQGARADESGRAATAAGSRERLPR